MKQWNPFDAVLLRKLLRITFGSSELDLSSLLKKSVVGTKREVSGIVNLGSGS